MRNPCCILPFKGKLPIPPVPVFVLGIKNSLRRQNIAFASEASWGLLAWNVSLEGSCLGLGANKGMSQVVQ